MTGVDSYSTTAATNATATGGSVNWAENQLPSTVNDSARQVLTDLRNFANDLIWFQYGSGTQGSGNVATPGVYASGTSFTIAGVDVRTTFEAGRRVRAVGSGTGTIYGTISSSSFSTNTTVNVTWDSGSLSNETLVISLSQVPKTGFPVNSHIKGSITNDSATAGNIGENKEGTQADDGSAISLTTATAANVTSVSLTAGDWIVVGDAGFIPDTSTSITRISVGINTTSATLPATYGTPRRSMSSFPGLVPGLNVEVSQIAPTVRISLSATTTVYLVAQVTFTVSTLKAYGTINAWRIR